LKIKQILSVDEIGRFLREEAANFRKLLF